MFRMRNIAFAIISTPFVQENKIVIYVIVYIVLFPLSFYLLLFFIYYFLIYI